jgi:BlaI family transcriptional regulator, penicillinase repressor
VTAIHVTEAEGELLEALWRHGPLSPARLIDEVRAVRAWERATIKTLLARLKLKQAVVSERPDGVLRYRALIDRPTFVEGEVRALIDRLFGGDAGALAAFLADRLSSPS